MEDPWDGLLDDLVARSNVDCNTCEQSNSTAQVTTAPSDDFADLVMDWMHEDESLDMGYYDNIMEQVFASESLLEEEKEPSSDSEEDSAEDEELYNHICKKWNEFKLADQGYWTSCGKSYESKEQVPQGALATFVPVLLGGNPPGKRRRGRRRRNRDGRPRNRQAPRQSTNLVSGHELGLRNPRQMTKFPRTVVDEWKYEVTLASDGSGQCSMFFALRNPLAAANGSGTYQRAPEFAKLYDEYKIMSLTVLMDPHVPSISPIGRLAIATDYDSIGSGTYTYSDLRDNEYMRDFLVTNQIAYVAKDRPLSEGTYRGVSAVIHQKGWYDFNSPPEEGFVAIGGEGFGASSSVAYILLTMKVKMRNRRSINLAREDRLKRENSEKDLLLKQLSKTAR